MEISRNIEHSNKAVNLSNENDFKTTVPLMKLIPQSGNKHSLVWFNACMDLILVAPEMTN